VAAPSGPAKQPTKVDVRPVNDRRNMAQVTRDAIDVRCLGTLGGWIGAFVGFLVFGMIGMWIGGAAVFLAFFPGILVGWWIGVRTALGLMAR
jgi:predicted lipid-binding transport protein (Tim44 family)